jgi:hypothetical protein
MPRHSHSGRRTYFGMRVGFMESYVVFTIYVFVFQV